MTTAKRKPAAPSRRLKSVSLPLATWEMMLSKASFCANYITSGTKSAVARDAAQSLRAVVIQAVNEVKYQR